jgi:hypothetical protein
VFGPQELLHRQAIADVRVAGAHRAHVRGVSQRLLVGPVRHAQEITHGQVHHAGVQRIDDLVRAQVDDGHACIRCQFADLAQHMRQQHLHAHVVDVDAVVQGGCCGREHIRLVHFAQDVQRPGHLASHVVGKRGRAHAMGRPDKQRVAKPLAQALEGRADRRLGQTQLDTGCRQAVVPVNGIKTQQQVQIEFEQVHGAGVASADRCQSTGMISTAVIPVINKPVSNLYDLALDSRPVVGPTPPASSRHLETY